MNTTLNATTTAGIVPHLYTMNMKVGFISAYIIIFLVGFFGNSIGLYVVCKSSNSKRATDLLITNLAIADLIITLTIMPYSVVYMHFEANRWIGGTIGDITCKVVFYAIPVSIEASVITMIVISLDRFYAVFYPLKQVLFHKQRAITLMLWIISLFTISPNLFLFQVFEEDNQQFCYQTWPWSDDLQETFFALRVFHVIMFLVLYPIPLMIIAVINALISRRLWLHRSPGSTSSSLGASVRNPRRNIVKMLVVIVVVFALCWFPTYLNHYFMYFQPNVWHKIPIVVKHLTFWISHSHSAINPLLYIALNKNFRSAFLEATSAIFSVPLHALRACNIARRSGVVSPPDVNPRFTESPRRERFSLSRVSPAKAVPAANRNTAMEQETKL